MGDQARLRQEQRARSRGSEIRQNIRREKERKRGGKKSSIRTQVAMRKTDQTNEGGVPRIDDYLVRAAVYDCTVGWCQTGDGLFLKQVYDCDDGEGELNENKTRGKEK